MTDESLQQNVEEIVREAAALMTRDFGGALQKYAALYRSRV